MQFARGSSPAGLYTAWMAEYGRGFPPMTAVDQDRRLRLAAFGQVRRLCQMRPRHDSLRAGDLQQGFLFGGERIRLVSPQRGIFKPRAMRFLLSIRTVFPQPGGRVWYDDQRDVHRKIYEAEETVAYAFMGKDPNAVDNRWLFDAWLNQIPIVYFLGVAPHRYQAIVPAFITEWNAAALTARVAFGPPGQWELTPPETARERRHALRAVKEELFDASFRQAVLTAYDGRCAVSGLPEPRLVEAVQIAAAGDPWPDVPAVSHGLLLSRLHRAAFDADLLGIDPDYRLHVSEHLLERQDGPLIETLKRARGDHLRLPKRPEDYPDRDRLAMRFARFTDAA